MMLLRRNQTAFTLIELLVVISIISLLSSVVLAALNSAREKGRLAALQAQDAGIYRALADSAVGVWKFNEGSGATTADLTGNGNSMAVSGLSWTTATYDGRGSAITFNNGPYLSVPAPTNLPATTLTVTAWVRISTFRNWSRIVAHYWTGDGGWLLYTDAGGRAIFGVSQGGGQYNSGAGVPLTTGVWHFLVGTYDGTTVSMYVDGVRYGTTAALSNVQLETSTGIDIGPGTTGDIDEVRVYSRALNS